MSAPAKKLFAGIFPDMKTATDGLDFDQFRLGHAMSGPLWPSATRTREAGIQCKRDVRAGASEFGGDLLLSHTLFLKFSNAVHKLHVLGFLNAEVSDLLERGDCLIPLEGEVRQDHHENTAHVLVVANAPIKLRLPFGAVELNFVHVAKSKAHIDGHDHIAVCVGDADIHTGSSLGEENAAFAINESSQPDSEIVVTPTLKIADLFFHKESILHTNLQSRMHLFLVPLAVDLATVACEVIQ